MKCNHREILQDVQNGVLLLLPINLLIYIYINHVALMYYCCLILLRVYYKLLLLLLSVHTTSPNDMHAAKLHTLSAVHWANNNNSNNNNGMTWVLYEQRVRTIAL